ncbi:MAG: hypothetical protein WB997_11180, partial [Candidatus Acidiferrales bacterium]
MTKIQSRIIGIGIICLAALILWQAPSFAQNNAKPNDSQAQAAPHDDKTPANPPTAPPSKTDPSAKGTSNPANAEILAELERMRARIAELEAQLKAQSGDAPATVPVAPPIMANNAAPTSASSEQPPSAAPTAPPGEPPVAPITLQTGDKKPEVSAPFAFADFTWLNGNSRTTESPLATKYFTPEFRADTSYIEDFNHPSDHTLVGSSESGRTGEVQLQQLGIGGDFQVGNVRGRLMTQFGMYSTMTPRNDGSPGVGQWNLADAY